MEHFHGQFIISSMWAFNLDDRNYYDEDISLLVEW